jgi:simple sugar transport system permease protein
MAPTAMLLALVVSAVLGWINGVIVVKTGIPSFITTLGTMLAWRG